MIISQAADEIIKAGEKDISAYYAPGDLYNRRQDTGKSVAEIFFEKGIPLTKSINSRVQGWYNLKEWLKPYTDETGNTTARLVIFENCVNLIRCLPAVCFDKTNPNDVASSPHELTHAPDALRYFAAARAIPAQLEENEEENCWDSQLNSFINY